LPDRLRACGRTHRHSDLIAALTGTDRNDNAADALRAASSTTQPTSDALAALNLDLAWVGHGAGSIASARSSTRWAPPPRYWDSKSTILRGAGRARQIRPGAVHEDALLLAADLKHHAGADHLVAGELACDGMQERIA
jgi:hypothetical protein